MASSETPTTEEKELLTQFDSFINQLHSTNETELICGCKGIRKILCITPPPIQRVINSSAVPRLVELMKKSNSATIQFESAWALTNIASGNPNQTRTVVNYGAIGVFVTLLNHTDADVREQAVWGLSNIASDSVFGFCDQVLRAGALEPLLTLATNSESRLTMIQNCANAVARLARGMYSPILEDLKVVIPVLAKLLFHRDKEVLTHTCEAISFLTEDDSPNQYKIRVITQETTIVPRLIELLAHSQTQIQRLCLHSLGQIVSGDDEYTRMVINAGAIPVFIKLLQSPTLAIRKSVCFALSNCSTCPEHIQTLIDAGVFPHVIRIVREDDPMVVKEGMWILNNACQNSTTIQMHYLIDQSIITSLIDALNPEYEDDRIAELPIDAITHILKSGVGDDPTHPHPYRDRLIELDIIPCLRHIEAHHKQASVQTKAKELLTTHFVGIPFVPAVRSWDVGPLLKLFFQDDLIQPALGLPYIPQPLLGIINEYVGRDRYECTHSSKQLLSSTTSSITVGARTMEELVRHGRWCDEGRSKMRFDTRVELKEVPLTQSKSTFATVIERIKRFILSISTMHSSPQH